MLSVACKPFAMSVDLLNVVMASVVAPPLTKPCLKSPAVKVIASL